MKTTYATSKTYTTRRRIPADVIALALLLLGCLAIAFALVAGTL